MSLALAPISMFSVAKSDAYSNLIMWDLCFFFLDGFCLSKESFGGRKCLKKMRFMRVFLLRAFRHAGKLLWQYFDPRMRKGSSEDSREET